ncbi:spore germination protein KA [Paenibacillus endophyticus]|uniref:Spore germination protein KA n=1 Tax=Paenibacillus endophyticus TaxID=1294268 RepID=A0A7W5CA33_9BACL|nr:spore germination protein [Paenibacillus endophyticus]MBB3153802.1 spore germination protein KA [Paenibacillus endophyticus]
MDQLLRSFSTIIQKRLNDSPDLVTKNYCVQEQFEITCMYLSTITDQKLVDELVISGILTPHSPLQNGQNPSQWLMSAFIQAEIKEVSGADSCIKELLEGQCIVAFSGQRAISINVCKQEQRSIAEPETESVVRGPREGFVEDCSRNISLIRKRLKSEKLVIEEMIIGSESNTTVCLIYMRGIADPDLINEFRNRLKAIQTESILESAYIEEYIQDKTMTPFPQFTSSERPDAIAAKLLEGQAAIITDGTPNVLAGPITFFQSFATSEDYYQRADIATVLRWLRMLAFVIAVFTPSLYISVSTYHQDLLPSSMLANLASQREGVPFPSVIEAFAMMIIFEVLREAGLRMPRISGQAISIVGALVLGQAAVEAGIVSAAMVIVVSLTAIANFVAPSYGFGIAQRLIQFGFMFLASLLGLFGVMCGVFVLLIHLVSLRSMGVPYFAPLAPLKLSNWRDTFIRINRPLMNRHRRKRNG